MTLLGIADIVNGETETGMAKIAGAFGILGLGHKIEKKKKY